MPEDASVVENQMGQDQDVGEPSAAVEAVAPFVGQWNQLVSHTNWEKGRIICEWREALAEAGAASNAYSDEAWSQLVGHVTPQHVGRLRRVYQRFQAHYEQYESLYWSHFFAALDWDDAEMWLEGAAQNGWSVSETRRMRQETLGAVASESDEDSDSLNGEMDEDFAGDAEGGIADAESADMSRGQGAGEGSSAVTDEEDEDAESEPESWEGGSAGDVDEEASESSRAAGVRPFAGLPELPDDLADAFESFKLAILAHKTTGWDDVAPDQVLASLDALKKLVTAP